MGDLYQQEIDAASKPVLARVEHYRKATNQIRELLKEYFFNTIRTLKLTEPSQTEEIVFNFNSVKDAMEICLADEIVLKETAEGMKNRAGHPGFVTAFDSHISKSTLPLEFQEDNCLYLFKPEKPYTPLAQAFMQQFAYALSTYRISLAVYEVYYAITFSKALQTEELKNYIGSIQSLKQQIDGDENLVVLLKKAKALENEIIAMLRAENMHGGIDALKEDIEIYTNILDLLLARGAVFLQNCYKEFPNDPILWMLHDRSWHALLKTLSGLLYADQYTYSTLYSTLDINKEFIGLIKSELDQFSRVALAKTPLLKIEIVKQAAKQITETKIDILAKLAEKGIELVEAPKVSMFSTKKSKNIYELMFQLYNLHSNNSLSEEYASEEYTKDDSSDRFSYQ